MQGTLQPHSHPNDFLHSFKKKSFYCYTIVYVLCFWQWDIWDISCLTRDWTGTPRIGRWINHWTARQDPSFTHSKLYWEWQWARWEQGEVCGSKKMKALSQNQKLWCEAYTMFLLTTLNRAVLLLESNNQRKLLLIYRNNKVNSEIKMLMT